MAYSRYRLRFSHFLAILLAASSILPALPPVPAQAPVLPTGLDPVFRTYSPQVDGVLRGLKQGIDAFSKGDYVRALQFLPAGADAALTRLEDYALLYRARAALMLDRGDEALEGFRSLQVRLPESPLREEAALGECQALLKTGRPGAVADAIRRSGIAGSAEATYYRGRAEEESGRRDAAIASYLRVYCASVNAPAAKQAEDQLKRLSHGFEARATYYPSLLERADNLQRVGRSREARSLLLKLARVKAPDAAAALKRRLLSAQADYGMGMTAQALKQLERLSPGDPGLQARVLGARALCYRRLDREAPLEAAGREALRLHPGSPETTRILETLAAYHDLNNRMEKAREVYLQLAARTPETEGSERAAWRAAFFAHLLGRHEEASREFAAVLAKRPGPRTALLALYWLGRCRESMEFPAQAALLFRRCREIAGLGYYGQRAAEALAKLPDSATPLEADPSFEPTRRLASAVQLPDPAIPALSRETAESLERARQLASAGLQELALSDLQRALRLRPGDRALRYFTGRIYSLQDDPANAILALRRLFPGHEMLPVPALPREVWELLFPVDHQGAVKTHAEKRNIDPNLVFGLIRQESGFDPDARSHANALGLMQLLPSTARSLSPRAGIARFSTRRLYNPDTNIAIGTLHLADLLQRYGPGPELSLAAYNAGQGRVERWKRDFGTPDAAAFVDRIPFAETRDYVKNVLSNQACYRALRETAQGSRE